MEKNFVLRTSGGREYTIVGFTRIGRDADCLIRYNDAAISGHHASVWIAQNSLWLKDDNSSGGIFINNRRIAPDQAHQLNPGDHLRLGNSQIELEVAGPGAVRPAVATRPTAPARRLTPIACATMLGCLLLFGLVVVPSAYFLFSGSMTGLFPSQAKVLSTSTPQPLLKPQEYAASGQKLAQAVAQLNQSELAFIQAAKGVTGSVPKVSLARLTLHLSTTDSLDYPLRQVAADAFRVATLADSLSQTMAAQDGGSQQAGQMASQYTSISNLSAALVIDAQDLREGLARGSITQESAANVVADYGARLWNPSVTDPTKPGNPFTTYLSDSSSVPTAQLLSENSPLETAKQLGTDLSSWVAASGEEIKKKFAIPDLGTIEDAMLVADLLTPEGQADANKSKQAAAAIIQPGGAKPSGTKPGEGEVTATFSSALTVGATDQPAVTPPRTMMTFPKGPAIIISEPPSNDIISNLFTDNGNGPTLVAQVPVKDTEHFVNLSISNISIKTINKRQKAEFESFEADVVYEFDVNWDANLVGAQFTIDCGDRFEVSTQSGSRHIIATGRLILYPGTEQAYCFATHQGQFWGRAYARFLVGDPAGATQRVDQLNTEEESRRLTKIAEEKTRLAVEAANAAGTQAALDIEHKVSTEVYGTRTAEFMATITEIARKTREAPTPANTETPLPTATFVPVLVDSFFHPGDVHTVVGKVRLQRGRLYRICLSGTMYTTDGPVYPNDVDYVNGIKVPLSGCVVVEGNGAVATVSCSKGVPEEDPGGFSVQIYDLGPD